MRDALSEALVRAASLDERVLLLTGDHGYALFDDFRSAFPDRFVNAGVAEQNMVGMAAGLAKAGFRPIVYGLSSFVPLRVLEQIKMDIAHDQLPVLLLGDGAGFVYSFLGTSHQSLEDIACTRVIPHLSVLSPADRFELTACMELAMAHEGPTYLRVGKADLGDVHAGAVEFGLGDLLQVFGPRHAELCMIATGSMVSTAVRLADGQLSGAAVWSAPSIKPIDESLVADICRRSGTVIVIEEHSVAGGLGSLIAEIAAQTAPVRVLRIGSNDRFSEFCGSYDYLLREHELDDVSVARRISDFLQGRT